MKTTDCKRHLLKAFELIHIEKGIPTGLDPQCPLEHVILKGRYPERPDSFWLIELEIQDVLVKVAMGLALFWVS